MAHVSRTDLFASIVTGQSCKIITAGIDLPISFGLTNLCKCFDVVRLKHQLIGVLLAAPDLQLQMQLVMVC